MYLAMLDTFQSNPNTDRMFLKALGRPYELSKGTDALYWVHKSDIQKPCVVKFLGLLDLEADAGKTGPYFHNEGLNSVSCTTLCNFLTSQQHLSSRVRLLKRPRQFSRFASFLWMMKGSRSRRDDIPTCFFAA